MQFSFSIYPAIFLILPTLLTTAQDLRCPTQTGLNSSDEYALIREQFPLIELQAPTRNPSLGGQSFVWCCTLAVNQWLNNNCMNTTEVRINEYILNNRSQFPCGAQFQQTFDGAPLVQVTYGWANQHCPGWELSETKNTTQWLQMLVGFILPSVVFTLNVPRRRKLKVWSKLFPDRLGSYRFVSDLFRALLAISIVAVDTIFWLCTVFAAAGPLLLSGLYEAWLDKRVVNFVDVKIQNSRMPLALRARILFGILCGNLDLFPAYCDVSSLAESLDNLDSVAILHTPRFGGERGSKHRTANSDAESEVPTLDPTFHSEGQSGSFHGNTDVQPSRTSLESEIQHRENRAALTLTTPAQPSSIRFSSPTHPDTTTPVETGDDITAAHLASTPEGVQSVADRSRHGGLGLLHPSGAIVTHAPVNSFVISDDYTHIHHDPLMRKRTVNKVSSRLRAMLSCQYSFGSTIGGPVLFFVGAFVYALLEIKEKYGNNDVAHALAFGIWWTVIPHIAMVAGFLLAGNNPNTVEGIIGAKKANYTVGNAQGRSAGSYDSDADDYIKAVATSYSLLFERAYEAVYAPASMWDRGNSKRRWLLVLCVDALTRYKELPDFDAQVEEPMKQLIQEIVMLEPLEWMYLTFFAFSLLFMPCLLGLLAMYWTPQIGFSCRSLTIQVYLSAQVLLLILWTFRLTWRDRYWCQGAQISRSINRIRDTDSDTVETFWAEVEELLKLARYDTEIPDSSRGPRERSWWHVFGPTDVEFGSSLPGRTKWTSTAERSHYVLCTIAFTISVFAGIGGTLMQTMGVYRNCLCKINAPQWFPSSVRDSAILYLSTNTSQEIDQAQKLWFSLGGVSIGVLVSSCFVGWWYQKRLRIHFKVVASKLHEQARSVQMRARRHTQSNLGSAKDGPVE